MNNRKEKNKKDTGFIALTLVISIASLMLAFVYVQSISTAEFFDETLHKEYRLMAYYFAGDCLDQATLNLAHDYFYTVTIPQTLPDFHCTIDSVSAQGDLRIISAHGLYQNVSVSRTSTIKIHDSWLEVMGN